MSEMFLALRVAHDVARAIYPEHAAHARQVVGVGSSVAKGSKVPVMQWAMLVQRTLLLK